MKALVMEEYGKIICKEVPVPEPGDDEVLVRVRACAICGSDVHGLDGSTGRRVPPIIMGHEAAGIVEKVGANVQDLKENDRITFDSTVYCGSCDFCTSGYVNLCGNRRVFGVSCDEYRFNGAFAEYVCVPARVTFKLPDDVTFEQAAMVEPLSVAVHAVSLAQESKGGCVVIGCGTIGLLCAQILRSKGFSPVIVADVLDEKLALAQSLGFEHRVNTATESLQEAVTALTGGEGVVLSMDAVGIDSTLTQSIQVLKKGGECILVGNLCPSVTLPLQQVVSRQLVLRGSCASSGEFPECLELIAQKKVDVDSLISKVAPLCEGGEWFNRLYNQEPGIYKVVLNP